MNGSTQKLREIESELLDQSKQLDRLQSMYNEEIGLVYKPMNKISTLAKKALETPNEFSRSNSELGNGELLQLHERILNNQDAQLDSLAELLGRQKKIGEMISNELDVQIEILDDVDNAVENTDARMRRANNGLDNFLQASNEESKGEVLMFNS
ncbi:Syntaxin-8 [Globomyces sp. JEL0801]|nr:Syntaxin-8 [Globomyces sp. JEL0801]